MAVAKVEYGFYTTLIGTDAEVVAALNTEVVPASTIVSIYYNGSNTTAVYRK